MDYHGIYIGLTVGLITTVLFIVLLLSYIIRRKLTGGHKAHSGVINSSRYNNTRDTDTGPKAIVEDTCRRLMSAIARSSKDDEAMEFFLKDIGEHRNTLQTLVPTQNHKAIDATSGLTQPHDKNAMTSCVGNISTHNQVTCTDNRHCIDNYVRYLHQPCDVNTTLHHPGDVSTTLRTNNSSKRQAASMDNSNSDWLRSSDCDVAPCCQTLDRYRKSMLTRNRLTSLRACVGDGNVDMSQKYDRTQSGALYRPLMGSTNSSDQFISINCCRRENFDNLQRYSQSDKCCCAMTSRIPRELPSPPTDLEYCETSPCHRLLEHWSSAQRLSSCSSSSRIQTTHCTCTRCDRMHNLCTHCSTTHNTAHSSTVCLHEDQFADHRPDITQSPHTFQYVV